MTETGATTWTALTGLPEELLSLAERCYAADGGMPLATDPGFLGRRWTGGNVSAFGLLTSDGTLLAAGAARRTPHGPYFTGLVDPTARGRGLGGALLDHGLALAAQLASPPVDVSSGGASPGDVVSRSALPGDVVSRFALPGDVVSGFASPGDVVSRGASPGDVASRGALPGDVASRGGSPPSDVASRSASPSDNALYSSAAPTGDAVAGSASATGDGAFSTSHAYPAGDAVDDFGLPGDAADDGASLPSHAALGGVAPYSNAASRDATVGGAALSDAAVRGAAFGDAMPGGAAFGDAAPGGAAFSDAAPDGAASGGAGLSGNASGGAVEGSGTRERASGAVVTVESETLTEDAEVLFASRGLRQVFGEDVLLIDLDEVDLPAPEWPDGAIVSSWTGALARRFHTTYHAAFRDRPGFPGDPADEWIAENEEDEDFLPGASLLVTLPDLGDVGFLTAARGWIVQVGVVPFARRRGVAGALIRESLRRMRADGGDHAWLTVNVNNPGAAALYRRLGFVDRGRRARYQR